jgi:hypothetical protein
VGRTRKPIRVGLSCISAEMSGTEPILPYVSGAEKALGGQLSRLPSSLRREKNAQSPLTTLSLSRDRDP